MSLPKPAAQHVLRLFKLFRRDICLQHSVLRDFALGMAANESLAQPSKSALDRLSFILYALHFIGDRDTGIIHHLELCL